jgi:acetyl esterase/lipase
MSEDRSILSREARPPDRLLRYGEHADQVIDIWHGENYRPVVIFVHGGFWRPEYDRLHARPLGEALAAEGWPVASIEYRREPGRPDATVEDIRTVLDRQSELFDDLGTGFVLAGHSAGGQLVLWAAATMNPIGLRGTVALAPVADLVLAEHLNLGDDAVPEFFGDVIRADLDPVQLPAPITPVVIVHGTDDIRVPISLAESYVEAHPTARLERVEDASHYDVIDPLSAAWHVVTAELTRLSG